MRQQFHDLDYRPHPRRDYKNAFAARLADTARDAGAAVLIDNAIPRSSGGRKLNH